MCLPSAQYAGDGGGGLHVAGDGVANLDGCNVFSNEAYVRPPYGPSLNFTPAPRWNVTRARFSCMQQDSGGGLMIWGTATLTNTNVYENVANVRLHFEPS